MCSRDLWLCEDVYQGRFLPVWVSAERFSRNTSPLLDLSLIMRTNLLVCDRLWSNCTLTVRIATGGMEFDVWTWSSLPSD